MTSRAKRPNEIEERPETSSEKKSKVRKLSTTNFIASMRARISEAKAEPIGPYHRKRGKVIFFQLVFNILLLFFHTSFK
jgi:hypothetical protein